jgi:hypothetical protein
LKRPTFPKPKRKQAFWRLQGLGEERFRYLLNALMRGIPSLDLARVVQQEWKECLEIAEQNLAQQLARLQVTACERMFGPGTFAHKLKFGELPQIKRIEGVTMAVLERMEELANVQRTRYLLLAEKEFGMSFPTGALLTATNTVFTEYRETLKDLQKMRFDLGLDEFKGPLAGVRGTSSSMTLPDGTHIQRQMFEAVNTLEEIFAKRGVPPPTMEQIAG